MRNKYEEALIYLRNSALVTDQKQKERVNKCKDVLQELVDMCLPVAQGLIYYLNSMLSDLKECYIGTKDFRIFKRDYLRGFSKGLSDQLQKSMDGVDPKYALAVIGVPEVVKTWASDTLQYKESKFVQDNDFNAWYLGQKHGIEYDISRLDLIEEGRT